MHNINYTFKFYITKEDLFHSSKNFTKLNKSHIFDIVFTVVAIIALIYTIITGYFFSLDNFKKILLVLCCIIFPVIQPLILYYKSCKNAKKFKDNEITLIFDDEKITGLVKEEKTEVKYENVYNFIKFKNMLVIMYDSIHGQIMPNRIFENNKDEFFNVISSKIKEVREKLKNEEKK